MTNKELLPDEDDLMMPAAAARLLNVEPRTLLRMAERGEIEAMRLPSGHRRYFRESVERIRKGTPSPSRDSKAVAS